MWDAWRLEVFGLAGQRQRPGRAKRMSYSNALAPLVSCNGVISSQVALTKAAR